MRILLHRGVKADARLYEHLTQHLPIHLFLPIRKINANPTIHVIITMMRMK